MFNPILPYHQALSKTCIINFWNFESTYMNSTANLMLPFRSIQIRFIGEGKPIGIHPLHDIPKVTIHCCGNYFSYRLMEYHREIIQRKEYLTLRQYHLCIIEIIMGSISILMEHYTKFVSYRMLCYNNLYTDIYLFGNNQNTGDKIILFMGSCTFAVPESMGFVVVCRITYLILRYIVPLQ